jgi:hypothetical protein
MIVDDLSPEERKWNAPRNPRALTSRLLELAPFLRKRGVTCERDPVRQSGYHYVTISGADARSCGSTGS